LKIFTISTNNPISRVKVAKVLGHLLGFLGFGTSGACAWLSLWKTKEGPQKKKKKKTRMRSKYGIYLVPSLVWQ